MLLILLNFLTKHIMILRSMKLKYHQITRLITTATLNDVKNKIPNVNDLVKKTDCFTKIKDIESKYFATSDYNKFTNKILDANIKEKKLVNESDIAHFINKTKHLGTGNKLYELSEKFNPLLTKG